MRRALPLFLTAFCACGDDTSSAGGGDCPDVELLVAASDYGGAIACGAPGCFEEPGRTTSVQLGRDPALVTSKGRTFFLAREQDVVFPIDPSCGIPQRGAIDLSVFKPTNARGQTIFANPHDVAVAGDGALWIPLYNTPLLAIVKDGVVGPTISLAQYDEDGNPQAEAIRIVKDKAFVALERLDDQSEPALQSTRPSQMLRIDVASRQVEAVVELAGRNPFNAMAQLGDLLFLAEPNNTDVADEPFGGIERFDANTSATQLLVREKDIGGSVTEVAVTERCGAAIVAGPIPKVNPTALVSFDPTSGAVLSTYTSPILSTPGFDLQGLVWRGDMLYVGDRRRGSNGKYQVHEFARTGTCTLQATGKTIDLPQPPVGLQVAIQ